MLETILLILNERIWLRSELAGQRAKDMKGAENAVD